MNWWYSTRLKVFIKKVGCAVVHWLLLWVMYCKSDNFCLFGFSKMVTHILICFCLLLWVKWLSSVDSAKCFFVCLMPHSDQQNMFNSTTVYLMKIRNRERKDWILHRSQIVTDLYFQRAKFEDDQHRSKQLLWRKQI